VCFAVEEASKRTAPNVDKENDEEIGRGLRQL
jgi:hypothetical protein